METFYKEDSVARRLIDSMRGIVVPTSCIAFAVPVYPVKSVAALAENWSAVIIFIYIHTIVIRWKTWP